MSNMHRGLVEIYASGVVPAAETPTDVLDVRRSDGVNLAIDYLGGGYTAVHIRPQFSFNKINYDANGQEIDPTAANQTWYDYKVGEWDAINNRTVYFDDVSRIIAASGTLERQIFSYSITGATACRFQVVGSSLTGPDAGAITISATLIDNRAVAKRTH